MLTRLFFLKNKMISKTIIIGYGNIDRADDGVAFAVINGLRRQLGQKMLEEGDTGLDDLNNVNDSIFISQLVPEIMELLTGYNRIVFVDAHVGSDMEDLNCSPVLPQYISSSFTHHMTPSALLAFLKAMYQHEPEAHLVSIRGYDFDFKRTFSSKVQALVQPAVNAILKMIEQ
jgi:hydrogenase maturation protease